MKDMMRAAVIVEPNKIILDNVKKPDIQEEEVLIKVKYCGICETDLKILKGEFSKEHLPFIPGHEFTGYVEKIGDSVQNIQKGQYVTVDVNLGCGQCYFCKKGQVLMCKECNQIGIHKDGGFAEYVKAPANKVYTLSQEIDETEAVLIEPFSNVVRTAKKAKYSPGKSIVVIGTSSIALMQIEMAKLSALSPIIVIGNDEQGLEKAKKCGADYILTIEPNVSNDILNLTNGIGADFVLETEGNTDNYQLSFSLVRPGGKVVGFGLTGIDDECSFKLFDIVLKEIDFVASVSANDFDIQDTISLINSKRFKLKYFTNTIYSLNNVVEAFEKAKNINGGKKIIISMFEEAIVYGK